MANRPTDKPETAPEIIEDIAPEEDAVDEDDEDLGPDEGIDEDLESYEEELFDPMQHLTQLLVTESGIPIVDVLQGIQDALDKQNKILYKLVSVVESK